MSSTDQFADCPASLETLPEPFRAAFAQHPVAGVRLIVYGPSFTTLGERRPATVLAVTDVGWLIAADDKEGRAVSIVGANFHETLFVEWVTVLLSGHIRIDYLTNGSKSASAAIDFNTVMSDLYLRAIDMLLSGVESADHTSGGPRRVAPPFADWPPKFRNAAADHLPVGATAVGATHWDTVVGGFHRELAPAGSLIATEHELLLIADPPAPRWERAGSQAKYGTAVTYFPLDRLDGYCVTRSARLATLDLTVHASHGGEQLHVPFPLEHEAAVRDVLGRADVRLLDE